MKIEAKGEQFVIVDFDECEAYKIACKIEKEGIAFYQKLLASIADPAVKEKIEFLLDEEKKHLDFFTVRLAAAQQASDNDDGFEEDNIFECFEYGIFQPYKEIQNVGSHIDDVKKAMRLAIIVEENTVKLYQQCHHAVSSLEAKEELLRMVREENKHKKLFENILESC